MNYKTNHQFPIDHFLEMYRDMPWQQACHVAMTTGCPCSGGRDKMKHKMFRLGHTILLKHCVCVYVRVCVCTKQIHTLFKKLVFPSSDVTS